LVHKFNRAIISTKAELTDSQGRLNADRSTPEAKLVPVELEQPENSQYIDVSTLYDEEAQKTEPLRRVLMPNRPEIKKPLY